MPVNTNIDQQFVSQDYSQRIAVEANGMRLILGWTATGMCFATALWLLPYYLMPGLALLAIAVCIAGYMLKFGNHFIYQSDLHFELSVSDEEVALRTIDERDELDITESISISSVRSVEYFEADEIGSLTLLGSDHYLEIPLWAFGSQSEMVLESIRARGISFEPERVKHQSDNEGWSRQRAA